VLSRRLVAATRIAQAGSRLAPDQSLGTLELLGVVSHQEANEHIRIERQH